MNDFQSDLDALGAKIDAKLREYEHKNGKVPQNGPAARLLELQQAHADLAARTNEAGQSIKEASKATLEVERKALADNFSKWVALVDAEYREEI